MGSSKYSKHQLQTAQGALYLIDHVGDPPPGMNFRQFTDQAISKHLERHSYYSPKKEEGHLTMFDLGAMRRRLRDLWIKNINFRTCTLPQLEGEDLVDTLLRKGTTEIFQREMLSNRYKYDRITFSESDLPGHADSISEAEGDEDDVAQAKAQVDQEGEQLEDEEAVGGARHQAEIKKLSRRAAAHRLSPTKDSDTSFKPMQDDMSSEGENDVYFDVNDKLEGVNKDNTGRQVESEAAFTSSAEADPAYVIEVKSESEDIEGVNAKTKSPKRRGRPRKHAATASTQSAHVLLPPAAEELRALQVTSPVIPAVPIQMQYVPATPKFSHPAEPAPVGQELRVPGEETIQDTDRTWSGTVKRKRQEVNSFFNAKDEDAAERPTKRQDNKTTIKLGPRVRNSNNILPGVASSSKSTMETSAPILTQAAPLEREPEHTRLTAAEVVDSPSSQQADPKQNLKDARSTVTEVTDSQLTQQAVSSQASDTRRHPAPFKASEQTRNFERFYRTIESATRKVITSIGQLADSVGSLDPSPPQSLEALYTRCWGSEWEAVRLQLTKAHVFTVEEVAMSLISAFLYDNVFNQHASVPEIQAKQSELKGTTGKAILRMLDMNNGGQRLAEAVRTIESEDAIVRLAQNEEQLQQQLHMKAAKYAEELWSTIVPHFRSLSTLARCYGLSSDRPEQEWLQVFMPAFTQLIESILRSRLELLATGCKHAYTFPDADAHYDLKEMEIHGARLKLPLQVMFTIFPGLSVMLPKQEKMEALTGTKAMVKVRVVKVAARMDGCERDSCRDSMVRMPVPTSIRSDSSSPVSEIA